MGKQRYGLHTHESAANVIGYTFARKLTLSACDALFERIERTQGLLPADLCPTVYYRGGHRTLTHSEEWNRGFEGGERRWEFFGNVEFLAGDDYMRTFDEVFPHGKNKDKEKEEFAKELRKKAAGQSCRQER